jgi:hypothetical protein
MLWFIFNLHLYKHIYTILQRYLTASFQAMPLNVILHKLLGVWLVLALTGPFHPHAPAPFSLAWVLTDAFNVLPMRTAWFGRPKFQCWSSQTQFQFLGHLHINVIYRLINIYNLRILMKSHAVCK